MLLPYQIAADGRDKQVKLVSCWGRKKSMIQSLSAFLFQLYSLVPGESYLHITCWLSLLSRISVIMMKQLSSKNEVREIMST